MKIDRTCHMDIIHDYLYNLLSMQEIADNYGVCRTTIHNILHSHEIDTQNRRITVSCAACGTQLQRTRKRVRRQHRHFCDQACWHAFLQAGRNQKAGPAERLTRQIISEYFDLQPDHVVCWKDGNRWNKSLANLLVFANQGDLIKYHRQQDPLALHIGKGYVEPVWDGSRC